MEKYLVQDKVEERHLNLPLTMKVGAPHKNQNKVHNLRLEHLLDKKPPSYFLLNIMISGITLFISRNIFSAHFC